MKIVLSLTWWTGVSNMITKHVVKTCFIGTNSVINVYEVELTGNIFSILFQAESVRILFYLHVKKCYSWLQLYNNKLFTKKGKLFTM